jgi:hypothetical protein
MHEQPDRPLHISSHTTKGNNTNDFEHENCREDASDGDFAYAHDVVH